MYDWIDYDFDKYPFWDSSIPIQGREGNQVISYSWCESIPDTGRVDIKASLDEVLIDFILPGGTETHRAIFVEGVSLNACNPDGVYWSLDIDDKDTPATHYEFRGGKGDDLVEISGYIDSLDSRSVLDGESFGTNLFDGGDGYDIIRLDAPSKKFELRQAGYDVNGNPEYVL